MAQIRETSMDNWKKINKNNFIKQQRVKVLSLFKKHPLETFTVDEFLQHYISEYTYIPRNELAKVVSNLSRQTGELIERQKRICAVGGKEILSYQYAQTPIKPKKYTKAKQIEILAKALAIAEAKIYLHEQTLKKATIVFAPYRRYEEYEGFGGQLNLFKQ